MTKRTLLPVPKIMTYLNLDDSDKLMVTLLASTVTKEIENYTNRKLYQRDICQYMNGCFRNNLLLKDYPVNSFYGIQTFNLCEIDFRIIKSSFYTLNPKPGTTDLPVRLKLRGNNIFRRSKRDIRLLYNAGYAQDKVPADLKTAYCEIIFWMLERLNSRKISSEVLSRNINHVHILMYSQKIPENIRKILNLYGRTEKRSIKNFLRTEKLLSKEDHRWPPEQKQRK